MEYLDYRRRYTNTSSDGVVAAADSADVTMVTAKAGWTVYVQKLHVHIITSNAAVATFRDSNSSPKKAAATDTAPGADTHYDWDFGARGLSLTEAKNFLINLSAAGLAFNWSQESYMRQTGNEFIQATGGVANFARSGQAFS